MHLSETTLTAAPPPRRPTGGSRTGRWAFRSARLPADNEPVQSAVRVSTRPAGGLGRARERGAGLYI